FLLGEDNDPSRSVGEALEQNEPPLGGLPALVILSAGRPTSCRRILSEGDVSGSFRHVARARWLQLSDYVRAARIIPNRPNRPLPDRRRSLGPCGCSGGAPDGAPQRRSHFRPC